MWRCGRRHKCIGFGKVTDKDRFVREYVIPLRPVVRSTGGRMEWFYRLSPLVGSASFAVDVVVCLSFPSETRAHAFLTSDLYKRCLRESKASIAIFDATPSTPRAYLQQSLEERGRV